MCGFAGIIEREQSSAGVLPAMLSEILHRGPDGTGQWSTQAGGWHVELGHQRLSIIDISGGAQPMSSTDGGAHITYNGEVYNYKELAKDLQAKGYGFRTQSDTESILYNYVERGFDSFRDLNGMFGLGIWDAKNSQLVLARDRFGVKPLYYGQLPDGGIIFCSELKPILNHPKIKRKFSSEGVTSYLFSDYTQPPLTILEGIYKLEPGHFVVWKDGRLESSQPYWELDFERLGSHYYDHPYTDADLKQEFLERVGQSVQRQLIADVPVGVFLSGGLDSSSVAALAQATKKDQMKTFSIGFKEASFDESSYARAVAKHIGSEHFEEILTVDKMLGILDEVLDQLDEPLADPSILPTYFLAELAARHVKVALGGDGGDELWAGYPTYPAYHYARVYRLFPKFFRKGVVERLIGFMPVKDGYQPLEAKAKRFAYRFENNDLDRHLRWMAAMDLPDLQRVIGSQAHPKVLDVEFDHPRGDRINDLLALDFSTYLPGSVLTKVDRASMAHSLEARPALLDNEFVEWAFSLPSSVKLRGGTTKFLFKEAVRHLLPADIIDRPKQGFGIPLAQWLRGPLKDKLTSALTDSPLGGWLDLELIRGWNEEHQGNRVDHNRLLWNFLVLDHWAKKHNVTN